MKKVSIIIPVYNAEKYLQRCINSIYKQTYNDFEIILIDDGSTDNSSKIYNKYKNKDNFKIIVEQNRGPSYARNNGLKNSNGEYIFFLDSDDYLDSDSLKILIENTESNTLVSLKHRIVYDYKQEKCNFQDYFEVEPFEKAILNGKELGVVWGFLFESNIIFNNNIEFDTNTCLCEDTIFLFEYLKNIKNIKFVNSYYNYYQVNNSLTNSNDIQKIVSNINYSFYSIGRLDEITDGNLKAESINAQIRLLNYELYKLTCFKDFKLVLSNENIYLELKYIYNRKLLLKDKIYIFSLLYFRIIIFLLFKLKTLLKNILNNI